MITENALVIPVDSLDPNFNFSVDLDNETYKFYIRWNETAQKWYLNISGITNDVLVRGIALVCGVDLLEPHGISELNELYMFDLQYKKLDADYDNFGTRYILVYEPKEA